MPHPNTSNATYKFTSLLYDMSIQAMFLFDVVVYSFDMTAQMSRLSKTFAVHLLITNQFLSTLYLYFRYRSETAQLCTELS